MNHPMEIRMELFGRGRGRTNMNPPLDVAVFDIGYGRCVRYPRQDGVVPWYHVCRSGRSGCLIIDEPSLLSLISVDLIIRYIRWRH